MSAKKKPMKKVKTPAAAAAPKKGGLRISAALLDQLVQEAKAVRENAYAPYSKYKVGAAIVTRSGSLYTGCNVENSTFGATICAERSAIVQMIANGESDPVACAVVTRDGGSPCGICRQMLSEFADEMPIVMVGLESSEGESGKVIDLADLLPVAFRGHSLKRSKR